MARDFDGTSQDIALGDFSVCEGQANFSIAMWVNLDTLGDFEMFFSKFISGTDRLEFCLGGAGYGGNNDLAVFFRDVGANTASGNTTGNFITTGSWLHIGIVFDASGATNADKLKIYVSGVSRTVTFGAAALPATTDSNAATAHIGQRTGGSLFIDAKIAEFAFWQRSLTGAEFVTLAGTYSPGWLSASRAFYADLINEVFDRQGVTAVTDDTSLSTHPTIIYPNPDFDQRSNSGYKAATAVYNWSHTCNTNGVNRLLTVGVSMLSVGGSSVSGITYNGVALSLVTAKASVSGAIRVELWQLVAPATGANTVEVTLSAALDSAAMATSYRNADQITPTEAANSASATNVGAADATVDITTVLDGDWVVDIVATDDAAITVGAGQIQWANVTGALGSGGMSTEGPKTPPGAVTMSWTNVAALATWSIAGAGVRAFGATPAEIAAAQQFGSIDFRFNKTAMIPAS